MRCPHCGSMDDRVTDSRTLANGESIRRRRECLSCGFRFTSYERIEEKPMMVVKRDGRREPFDRQKLERGLQRALEKRPVSQMTIENILNEIEDDAAMLGKGGNEVPSSSLGEMTLHKLYSLDKVAYIRFASVYRKFESMVEFMQEIERLENAREGGLTMSGTQQIFPEWRNFLGTEDGPGRFVAKRSGSVERYDRGRIERAIDKAFKAVTGLADKEKVQRIAADVESRLALLLSGRHPNSIPAIEEIQDLVETALIEAKETQVARAYILYRAKREAVRDAQHLMLDINSTMDGYLAQVDWRVKENANVNYSLGGLVLHNSGTVTANYWLKNIYPEEIASAHRDADFHIHDLSMFSGYCAGWSLRQLIAEGLGGVPDKITSAPAKHLSTLVQQMVNFMGILQNEWAGAQAFSSFDTYLAPFVKVDALGTDDVRQCVQSFMFGVNTPSRWGSQAPFTNITLDWTCPADLRDRPAVIGGLEQSFTYGDCQREMDVINQVFIELMLGGDADGRGFQYPIPTYNITRDFDWDSGNARLLFEMTAKYGTPYFQNFVNSDLDPGDVRSMCCRLQLDKRELRKRGGGLFGSDELTGSIGVVTLNMPRLGYLSDGKSDFYRRLDRLMDLAAKSLTIKRKVCSRLLDGGLFPYTKRYLKSFDNHFSTIGLVGMNECCLNFMGLSIVQPDGKAFAEEVLEHMRKRLQDYQVDSGELFNLEATPAESTSYRLAKHDRKRYPDIISAGADEPYYTNSSQLPADYTEDLFDAMDHQEALQAKYTGGTVFHVFLGEAVDDWRALRDLVRTIAGRYRIPYYTISPTFSVCPIHGYISGEHFSCPKCKAEKEARLRDEIAVLENELSGMA